MELKRCLYCNSEIPFKENQKPSSYKARKFCNSSCAAKYNNHLRTKVKLCVYCGKQLKNSQKKYCSPDCEQSYKYDEYISNWKNGLISGTRGNLGMLSNYVRKYIFIKYNNKCCKCNWNKINPYTKRSPLEIHHIDGDAFNNKEENLELLCPNCHSLTDTYKNSNNHKSSRVTRNNQG